MMKQLNRLGLFVILINLLTSCNGQTNADRQNQTSLKSNTKQIVGGGCEGCELMYVGMPEKILTEHTSIGWTEGKQKLILTGKVYQLDGKTPAPNVIVY